MLAFTEVRKVHAKGLSTLPGPSAQVTGTPLGLAFLRPVGLVSSWFPNCRRLLRGVLQRSEVDRERGDDMTARCMCDSLILTAI